MSERLTTTIKHFKDGVTKMGMTAARHSIDSWKTELEGYEGTIFKTIATDLGHLHDELGKDEIDGAKVAKLMAKLGKETVKSAKEGGDKSDVVKELGEALEHAAEELGGAKGEAKTDKTDKADAKSEKADDKDEMTDSKGHPLKGAAADAKAAAKK